MKKKNCNSFLIFLIYALFVLSSCYYDNEEELYPGTGGPGNCDTVAVSFTSDINPLIQTKCAISGCHLNAQTPLFTSYAAISGNKDKIRQRVVISKDMPPSNSGITMSEAERQLINNWICQGALNN